MVAQLRSTQTSIRLGATGFTANTHVNRVWEPLRREYQRWLRTNPSVRKDHCHFFVVLETGAAQNKALNRWATYIDGGSLAWML